MIAVKQGINDSAARYNFVIQGVEFGSNAKKEIRILKICKSLLEQFHACPTTQNRIYLTWQRFQFHPCHIYFQFLLFILVWTYMVFPDSSHCILLVRILKIFQRMFD